MTVRGWRAHIGFLQPTSRGSALEFWQETAPEGVSLAEATIGYPVMVSPSEEDFLRGLDRASELAAELVDAGCESIVIAGTPPFLMMGPDREEKWAEDLEYRIGVPVATAMLPHAKALLALDCKNVLAATYYGDTLNSALVGYFEAVGIRAEVAAYNVASNRKRRAEELQTGSHDELKNVDFPVVYRHIRSAFLQSEGSVDAVYINGSGWNAEPAVQFLERDLGVPAVWAQHALSWYVYRKLHINAVGPVCRLHEGWPGLPATLDSPSSE